MMQSSGMWRLSLPGAEDQTTTAFPATPAWTKGMWRTNTQNPLGHQSHRRRPRDLDGRLANKSYNSAFLSGPKWFVCHGGLGTLLLRYLREWSKGPVSLDLPGDLFLCGEGKPRQIQGQPTKAQAGRPQFPERANVYSRIAASWKGQCRTLQRPSMSAKGCWGGGGGRSVRTEQRLREATTQLYAPQSPQARGAHKTLAVSQGLGERKWEGTRWETELLRAA